MNGLLSKKFPIIFKSVHGYCKRPDDDTRSVSLPMICTSFESYYLTLFPIYSSFNMEEVNAVMEFVGELLKPNKYQLTQSDIGIVSPYKLQCKIVRQHCDKKRYGDIRIGSAETFQGQERKVMIISTVRSGQKTLGKFLKNPQVHYFHLLCF